MFSQVREVEISSKSKPEQKMEKDKSQDKTDTAAAIIVKTKSQLQQQSSKLSCEFCSDDFRSERSLRMHKFICDKKKVTSKSKSSHLNEVINAKVQNLNAKANCKSSASCNLAQSQSCCSFRQSCIHEIQ